MHANGTGICEFSVRTVRVVKLVLSAFRVDENKDEDEDEDVFRQLAPPRVYFSMPPPMSCACGFWRGG